MLRPGRAVVSSRRRSLSGLGLPGALQPYNALAVAEGVTEARLKDPVRQERAWRRASSVGQPTSPLRRLALMAAAALFAMFIPFASVFGGTSVTLGVHADGTLPGFHRSEVPHYVARQMEGSRLAAWRFKPVSGGGSRPIASNGASNWLRMLEVKSAALDPTEMRLASVALSRSRRGSICTRNIRGMSQDDTLLHGSAAGRSQPSASTFI
jgi:hypothetical protein